jgi:hypothetical protein
MVLTGDCGYELIDAIVKITEDIKSETMKSPKGSLYEPHRTQINGITKAYVKLAQKSLDRLSAEPLIHYLYFEFEKPVSEYLGFAMSIRIPLEYMITK